MRSLLARVTLAAGISVLLLLQAVVSAATPKTQPPPSAAAGILHLNPDSVRLQLAGSREDMLDVNNQSTIMNYLREFGAASADNQEQIFSELTDYCIERGLRPSPDLAELFLALALEAKEQGKADDFQRLTRYAVSFAPSHPGAHLALAEAARTTSGVFSGEYYYETITAILLTFEDVETRWIALSNVSLWLRTTAFLLLFVVAITLLVKYEGLLRHDVREWLGGKESKLVELGCLVAIFMPSLLLLSGYWWIIYWAGVFLPYARWRERLVTLLCVLLLVASGAMLLLGEQRLYLSQSPPHVSNVRCYANRIGIGPDSYLSEHVGQADPLNHAYTYLLASRHLLHGSYVKSEELFQALLKEAPNDAMALNNLGCLYFYENRFQEAIQQFNKSIASRPDFALAYLNRSIAKNKVFDFSGAKEDQVQARALFKNSPEDFEVSHSEESGPFPIWLSKNTTRDIALRLILQRGSLYLKPLQGTTSWIGYLVRPAFSFWALLFAAIFLFLTLVKKANAFARSCYKCGHAFCHRCKTSLEFESFCSQCVHLYIKQDGVSPEARLKKNYEVERYTSILKIQRAVFALLAPGAGHLFEGRPLSAVFLLFLWCGLIAGFVVSAFAYPLPYANLMDVAPLRTLYTILALGLMLILWCAFGLPMALKSQPPQVGRYVKGQ